MADTMETDHHYEQIVIVIEQGTITQFNQSLLYPNLQGVNGDGI
jgi:hypothetical protein